MNASELKSELRSAANAQNAKALARFFKTGKGEYGEGDRFLGVMTSEQRRIAKAYFAGRLLPPLRATLAVVRALLHGGYHEERSTALKILVGQYQKSDDVDKKRIFDFYIDNLRYINN
ncbi:MAG: DNA alkylation repair protein, partial [Candidatus Hydrogenedentes bacterium]|nr:DNA alkylation repair protein [Candidatus Hydrogenedentota bacterium]